MQDVSGPGKAQSKPKSLSKPRHSMGSLAKLWEPWWEEGHIQFFYHPDKVSSMRISPSRNSDSGQRSPSGWKKMGLEWRA